MQQFGAVGAALPEVIVATALLAAGMLGSVAMMHAVVLHEKLHDRRVSLYWHTEALNSRIQILRSPGRSEVVSWEQNQPENHPDCAVRVARTDLSVDDVVREWRARLGCWLPVHRGRVETTPEYIRLELRWPSPAGSPSAGWRELERTWPWFL